ncbi:Urocanate reductase [bioreactor metagenome]|uniref:Urocanate reductase n=1 Tax=bioreactor metagenome TaxID=1076179 RepID=A0A645B537_9ZZZZ
MLGDGSIDSIEVTNIGGETADIIQTAIDKLIPRIMESQSIAVDSIAGATASSSGIKTAVATAIDGAGGDSSQWYTSVAKKADIVVLNDYDVVVVGLGGAGMPAFCSAAETGAAVIGIEAAGKIGGTSTNVGGPMTVNPKNAEVQPAVSTAGYPVDTAALKSQWLSDTKGEAKENCIDLMLEDSGSTLDWLIDSYGFTFGPLQNFMGNNFIVYSSYRPAAGQTVTDMYVHAIEKACEYNEKNKYVLELKAIHILTDGSGEVCGVSAEYYDGTIYEIYAPSVILCTGGFGGSSEMTEQYIGSAMSLYGMYQNDGTMLEAAINKCGAATYNIATPGISHAARTTTDLRSSDIIPSHQKTLDAIVVSTNVLHVDEDGNRFCQGDTTTDITENAYKAGNCYYSIVTQDYMDKVKASGLDQVYMMINGQDESLPLSALMGGNVELDPETTKYALMTGDPITDLDEIIALGEQLGIVYKADSLEELAKLIGADNLASTVTAYNGYCASGTDPEFNKNAENMAPLDAASTTFYAIKGTSYCYSTCGGLDVNEKIEVLDTNGNVIKGLYACGTDSMGVLLNVEEGYIDYGGVAHGWCFTSGKLAGQNAAAYALSKKD